MFLNITCTEVILINFVNPFGFDAYGAKFECCCLLCDINVTLADNFKPQEDNILFISWFICELKCLRYCDEIFQRDLNKSENKVTADHSSPEGYIHSFLYRMFMQRALFWQANILNEYDEKYLEAKSINMRLTTQKRKNVDSKQNKTW